MTEIKRKIVILTITEACNLKCSYCFETEKTEKVMNIEVAKDAITYAFNNSSGFDEIEFDLFGGEPTLCKELIKKIVDWTYRQNFKKPYLFFLETNGTLVHGDFKKWLIDNSQFVYAGLSLDGTPETHNKNRSNSYAKIDIDFFLKNYPKQSIRMTVCKDTVDNLSNDIIHLHRLGFLEVVATFAHGVDWEIEKIRDVLDLELMRLCNFYLKNPGVKVCSILDMNLFNIQHRDKKIGKWCGSGTSMVSIGIDGTKYPCHTFQSCTATEARATKLGKIDFDAIDDFSDPACANCILEPICPNCYGMNYVKNGNILARDKQLCEIVKMRAVATSYLMGQKINKNLKQFTPSRLFQTILAIKKIQNNFVD
ncbi:4Fe-4S cluster-binding domain-containing protein [Candidatus Parcubacteria bacterium]|nr:4Fe-4S cluster-binding domain-containing protein [Candidatus Parcubacteria bacterium]